MVRSGKRRNAVIINKEQGAQMAKKIEDELSKDLTGKAKIEQNFRLA